jgi:hypothetical protein
MRLAIDAITQAEGAAPAAVAPPPCSCHACHATAHADPTAPASSHPAATSTADATTPDRRRAGAHVYAHAHV